MSCPQSVSREEALGIILSNTGALAAVTLPLEEILGCASSMDLYATQDIPPFNRAAMDGYALKSADTTHATPNQPVTLQLVGEVDPSTATLFHVETGQAVRIMTGGPMPPGTDAVIKEEDVQTESHTLAVPKKLQPLQHVRKKGDDLDKGALFLKQGKIVTPAVVNIMANLQIREAPVIRKPEISIISVGSELVDLHETATGPKIVASNIYMLSAMIKEQGGRLKYTKICLDDRDAIGKAISEGLQGDMLITTGGSSNAHSDLTRVLLGDMGLDFKFVGLSMRPGKGTSFGLYDDKPVFCLPGTPSAVYVVFHTLILPALLHQMGLKLSAMSSIKAILEKGIKKKPGLEHVVQGAVKKTSGKSFVVPLAARDTALFSAMGGANGLIFVSPEQGTLKEGETVHIQLVNSSEFFFSEPPAGHAVVATDRHDPLPPIVSIVGKSDAGKTTLLEKLVGELKSRQRRVGTIKHDVHGFDIDHEGKDSWRHKKAGASTVVISSPQKVAVVKDVDKEESLDSLVCKYFADADIVITEGYKKEDKPKIEVFRSQVHESPLCMEDPHLVAFVSDTSLDMKVPRFGLEDVVGLADLIEKVFLARSD